MYKRSFTTFYDTPVSYTHLDVYKRQVIVKSRKLSLLFCLSFVIPGYSVHILYLSQDDIASLIGLEMSFFMV